MLELRRSAGILTLSMLTTAGFASQPDIVVSRLYAATADGAFLTYSWGEQWIPLLGETRGFTGEIRAFACLGVNVFAGGGDGVFISVDFGENYRPVDGFAGKNVTTLRAARLFALEPTLFAGTASGLYRSIDAGDEWERVASEMIEGAVHAIEWPGPELFAVGDGGLFVSTDSGDEWERLDVGLPKVPVLSIAISQFYGLDPTIFVGTRGAGLYRSTDGGESFELIEHALVENKTIHSLFWWGELLLVGTDEGLVLSNDVTESLRDVVEFRGQSVLTINVPFPDGMVRSDVLIGTDAGVFKSSDGALSFRLVDDGIGTPRVFELSTFPPPPVNYEPPRL